MEFSWNEYQKALNVVKTFEKEREAIKSKRRYFNWQRTLNDIIWEKRIQINKEEYSIRNLTTDRKRELGELFLSEYIKNMKDELLKIRFRVVKKIFNYGKVSTTVNSEQ